MKLRMAQLAYGKKENSFCLPCFFFPFYNLDFRRILGKITVTGTVKIVVAPVWPM